MPELEDAFNLGEADESEDNAGTEEADSSDSD